jgi:hypothetical protein
MSFFTRIIVVAVALGMVASGRPVHKPKHAHTAIATDAADSLPVDVATSTGVITLTASSTEDGVSFAPTPVSRCALAFLLGLV